jgi:hypothetical protein
MNAARMNIGSDGAGLSYEAKRVYLIDDLLGTILLFGASALVLLLELTRRQICFVYQFAFLLCAGYFLFIIGGLLDYHLSDEQLQIALYRTLIPSNLTSSYIYLPVLGTICSSGLFMTQLSICSCDCCCLVGSKRANHRMCFSHRIRSNFSLYASCFVGLFLCTGTRLNVRLRESAINPIGGTLHWQIIKSPSYMAVIHLGAIVLVILKLVLQHADRQRTVYYDQQSATALFTMATSTSSFIAAPPAKPAGETKASVAEELIKPPSVRKITSPKSTTKSTMISSRIVKESESSGSESSSSLSRSSPAIIPPSKPTKRVVQRRPSLSTMKEEIRKLTTPSTSAATSRAKPPSSKSKYSNEDVGDVGDVSSLISSDSESDEEFIRPNSSPTDIASSSGYASSPTNSMRSRTIRTNSNASTSTLALSSDNEWDEVISSGYGTDSILTTSQILRRKTSTPPEAQDNNWAECYDPASGSVYYYNDYTGESSWSKPASFSSPMSKSISMMRMASLPPQQIPYGIGHGKWE